MKAFPDVNEIKHFIATILSILMTLSNQYLFTSFSSFTINDIIDKSTKNDNSSDDNNDIDPEETISVNKKFTISKSFIDDIDNDSTSNCQPELQEEKPVENILN